MRAGVLRSLVWLQWGGALTKKASLQFASPKPATVEGRVLELAARIHEMESRLITLEGDAASGRLVSTETTRRLDSVSREMRQLSAAVERLVDDAVPAKLLAERAAKSAEASAQGIQRILERLETLCHSGSETTLTDLGGS